MASNLSIFALLSLSISLTATTVAASETHLPWAVAWSKRFDYSIEGNDSHLEPHVVPQF